MTARPAPIGALLLLTAAACSDAVREAEIACQQRLADMSTDIGAVTPEAGPRASLMRARARFSHMNTDGCTEAQRGAARGFVRVTREMAIVAGRLGNLREAVQRESIQGSRDLMIFHELLVGFENRRLIVRRDLSRMIRDNR